MTIIRPPWRDPLPPIEPGHVPASMRPHIEAIRRRGRLRRAAGLVVGTIFYGSLLCLATFFAWLFAQVTDREVPSRTTIEFTQPIVAPGADLVMIVRPHLLKLCEGQVVFRAYDREGNAINRSETEWGFPVAHLGDDRTFVRKLRISGDALPSSTTADGKTLRQDARLRIERKFFCNGVQKALKWPIVEVSDDMTFAISAPDRR